MVSGVRTGLPFGLGVVASLFFTVLFPDRKNYEGALKTCSELVGIGDAPSYIYKAEHWTVQVKTPITFAAPNSQKVIRSRFAATELGIREKLVVLVIGQSSLSLTLNSLLGTHVSRVQIFVDAARVDSELSSLPNLTPFRQTGQHTHVHILNAIYNLTFHENFDWFLLVSDTTYVNPFELNRLIDGMSWNKPLAIGEAFSDGKCNFRGGILLSNPAVQLLLQERNLCSSIVANSDYLALEMCIQHATNLSCQLNDGNKGATYNWWRFEDSSETGLAIHERIIALRNSIAFNSSITVSSLLSDLDAHALHEHFVGVEVAKLDAEIEKVSAEITQLERKNAKKSAENLNERESKSPFVSWPAGLPEPIRPINRYQVPVWEFFTETHLFKNWPNQNVDSLSEDDLRDINEIVLSARQKIEQKTTDSLTFLHLRNGYRAFNALRGMEYVVDLVYRRRMQQNVDSRFSASSWRDHFLEREARSDNIQDEDSEVVLRRVHLCRPIFSTELVEQVPYVKEDTDITLVIPVETSDEISAARSLFSRHARLCATGNGVTNVESRQTRIILAARNIDAFTSHQLNNDLSELKNRCKTLNTETSLLVLKSESNSLRENFKLRKVSIRINAMDEAVDHYGQQGIYVLISPYSDYQREFLDRVRISTIRRYQVFFPIPFAEFNPLIANSEKILRKYSTTEFSDNEFAAETESLDVLGERIRKVEKVLLDSSQNLQIDDWPIVVHKDHGVFDINDFTVFSTYGADYLMMRESLSSRNDIKNKLDNIKGINKPQNEINEMENNIDGIKEKIESVENQNDVKVEEANDAPNQSDENSDIIFDVIDLFIKQTQIHVLRAIEPSLRVRYYRRSCSSDSISETNMNQGVLKNDLDQGDLNVNVDPVALKKKIDPADERCQQSRKNSFGMKAQMANLVFRNIIKEDVNLNEKSLKLGADQNPFALDVANAQVGGY